jgi:predicted transposase YbfD/YdcC
MNQSTEAAEAKPEGWVFDVGSLYARLSQLKDQRDRRGVRYPLAAVLVIVVLAKLAGEDKPLGIAQWARHRAAYLAPALGLKRVQMPHEVTYSRVLGHAVVADELERVVGAYLSQAVGDTVQVTMDGKTLRGTIPPGSTQGVHLLAAYVPEAGVVLLQIEVGQKENEIVVAPKLLAGLDLEGRIVTGDAMFAQRQLSIQIVRQGGHYLWTVKGNQASLLGDIARLFAPESCPPGCSPLHTDFRTASTLDHKHGRLERRTLTTSRLLNDYVDWPHLGQVFKLERAVTHRRSGQTTLEIAYGVTSLTPTEASPARLLHLIRRHWSIENQLHYPRDVTLGEDRCRLRMGCAARVMATLNNLVLGLIRQHGFAFLPQARRFYNAFPLAALELVLCA